MDLPSQVSRVTLTQSGGQVSHTPPRALSPGTPKIAHSIVVDKSDESSFTTGMKTQGTVALSCSHHLTLIHTLSLLLSFSPRLLRNATLPSSHGVAPPRFPRFSQPFERPGIPNTSVNLSHDAPEDVQSLLMKWSDDFFFHYITEVKSRASLEMEKLNNEYSRHWERELKLCMVEKEGNVLVPLAHQKFKNLENSHSSVITKNFFLMISYVNYCFRGQALK